ncbi:MAG TPA: hypothetical protein VI981_01895 [Candidatus Paceibacterota bacterium]
MREKKSSKRDQYTIVLEDVRSDFKLFGEELQAVRGSVERLDGKVDQLDGKIDRLDGKVDQLDGKVDRIEGRVVRLEENIEFVKGELTVIRHNQVTRDEFKLLETRVLRLEKRLK